MSGSIDPMHDGTMDGPAGRGETRQAILPVTAPGAVVREPPVVERVVRRIPLGDRAPQRDEGPLVGLGAIVVVPCYNEAERLPCERIREFAAAYPDIGFLFVDDGSRDDTIAVLRGLATELGAQADTIRLPRNRGKAEAVRAGLVHAMALDPRYVAYWDADLATPLDMIPVFASLLERKPSLQLVMGARVQLLGSEIERLPARHYAGRLFAAAASITLRIPVYDTQCGAKMFRVTDEVRAVFADEFHSRWIFDVEMLGRLLQLRRRAGAARPEACVHEYALPKWTDVRGSKLGLRHYVTAAFDLAGIWRRYRRA